MGVNSLWDIVGPAARPVKLEALSRKKLAVDASIWIYQFLKAVRDKDGNKLGQLHIVGFFRRICKLLYYGILPVFVFDGGAPPLKRQVIQKRRERRQGNSDNAQTTAQKLLAVQLQRRTREAKEAGPGTLYLEDLPLLHPEHPQKAQGDTAALLLFVRKDEFHLPQLKHFKVARNDGRIMPESEFQDYAADASFDVVDGVPIDSVDPASAEFAELPMATQYMILSHLRLRSRLRLGYTKDQLEQLFPDSRDFSRFQIQQVQKRNFYTQRLMNVSGMDKDTGNATRRIAGDKDKQYALVKNEGGWTLALGEHDEANPIVLDDIDEHPSDEIASQFISRNDFRALNERANNVFKTDDLKGPRSEKETVKAGLDSDSDNLEDVSLGDDQSDNEDKAIIESIYDQFKHEYEPTGVKVLDAMDRDELEHLDAQHLQHAIEESRKDYAELQLRVAKAEGKREEPLSGTATFDFGLSILFGSDVPELKDPENLTSVVLAAKDTEKADQPHNTSPAIAAEAEEVSGTRKIDKSTPLSEAFVPGEIPSVRIGDKHNIDNEEDHKEPEARVWEMPSWFGNNASQIASPYSQQDFVTSKQAKEVDEDEEAGLIPWSEARDMIEASDSGSDVEIIQENWNTETVPDEEEPKAPASRGVEDEPQNCKRSDKRIGNYKKQKKRGKNHIGGASSKQSKRTGVTNDDQKMTEKSKLGTDDDSLLNKEEEPKSQQEGKPAKDILVYEIEENDEEELIKNLETEEDQHEQFRAELGSKLNVPINNSITDEQLLQEKLQKAKRDLDEVTETMIRDVQELLKRFGIPYITAPMEAEAQCAELLKIGLVDGIVTDDSDCFLFGGSRIYKNMFNQKQYVECYIAGDIEHKIGLDQKKLIELALLLGSDYTEGIKGIGPVMAMEVLAEFGTLKNFKQWFDVHTKSTAAPSELPTLLEKKLLTRIKSGKLFLPDGFPSAVVTAAYTRPEVDHDDSELKWGVPSLDQIRTFLMYNVQWSQARVDEVMVPLIRDMNRKRMEGTQATIGEFFPQEYISYKKNVGLGKRMKVAASKLSK